jgi:hypothetical protein
MSDFRCLFWIHLFWGKAISGKDRYSQPGQRGNSDYKLKLDLWAGEE